MMAASFSAFFNHWKRFFHVDATPMPPAERWRSALGALLYAAGAGTLLYEYPVGHLWLLAPLGASAVILYALPHSPVAAPWAVLGGCFFGTICAFASLWLIPYPPLAAAFAVASSIWVMARLNCVHPPGGAMAFLMVISAPHSAREMLTLGLAQEANVGLILVLTLFINRVILKRSYPWTTAQKTPNPHLTGDDLPETRLGLTHEDLSHAVNTLGVFVDVQEGELVELYNLAVDHAFQRHSGLTCRHVMSHDVVTVEFATPLEDAWALLKKHHVRALPVVDRYSRVLGIVTVTDFLRQLEQAPLTHLKERLKTLLQPTTTTHSEKPETVGQIMTDHVYTATVDTPVSELIKTITTHAIHHVPVVDQGRRLVGIITPTDINAALYKQVALCIS